MFAYQRVVKNKGAGGVDGVGVAEFKDQLKRHWLAIKAKLPAGSYVPSGCVGWTFPSRKAGYGHSAFRRSEPPAQPVGKLAAISPGGSALRAPPLKQRNRTSPA